MIIDGFLSNYKELKELSLECEFKDIKNDFDGVCYPDIFLDIPESIRLETIQKLEEIHKKDITINKIFMRMTKKGTKPPHFAHTDKIMGSKSLMLYLNDHDLSGTSFLRHIDSGCMYHPASEDYVKSIFKDQNDLNKWTRYMSVSSKENRAVLFDSSLIHCADPHGGFGKNQRTARIVMTCFYD